MHLLSNKRAASGTKVLETQGARNPTVLRWIPCTLPLRALHNASQHAMQSENLSSDSAKPGLRKRPVLILSESQVDSSETSVPAPGLFSASDSQKPMSPSGAPTSGSSRLPSFPRRLIELMVGFFAWVQRLWRGIMRIIQTKILGHSSLPAPQVAGAGMEADAEVRLKMQPAKSDEMALKTAEALVSSQELPAAAAAPAATAAARPTQLPPSNGLRSTAAAAPYSSVGVQGNIVPANLRPYENRSVSTPARAPASQRPASHQAPASRRRTSSWDLGDFDLHGAPVPVNLRHMGARAHEVLAQVHHVFHDTPGAAAELAGGMMGRPNYHHARPGTSLSPPSSPTSAARPHKAAQGRSAWRTWSHYLLSRLAGEAAEPPDVSLKALTDQGASGGSGLGRRRQHSWAAVQPLVPARPDACGDLPGQATCTAAAGPQGSEFLAEGLRTASRTIMHPQAAAAQVAGRMLGKSSGHE